MRTGLDEQRPFGRVVPRGFPMDFSHENPWLKVTPLAHISFKQKNLPSKQGRRGKHNFFNGGGYFFGNPCWFPEFQGVFF